MRASLSQSPNSAHFASSCLGLFRLQAHNMVLIFKALFYFEIQLANLFRSPSYFPKLDARQSGGF